MTNRGRKTDCILLLRLVSIVGMLRYYGVVEDVLIVACLRGCVPNGPEV